MKMETAIDGGALLDHVEFHIIPSQNRYEAFVCCGNKIEKVTSGLLEHLLLHSAEIKALQSKGSNAKYKLRQPENSHDIKWFTKSTLIRFLLIIGSTTILDVTNSLKNEISQLEEARKFHLSLYAKGREYQLQSGESDASKNELLRAMDLRLATLTEELITALDQAAGSTYSVEDMSDIEKLSKYFGSENLSDSLRKYLELRQAASSVGDNDRVRSKEGNNHAAKSSLSDTQVKYGVSPAKVAQVERQNSTESDESSFSSEEEQQPSEERSRTMARTASPRRSASPMRRVQIGRSGSRRSTAITIKSLNYFPGRERSSFSKDPSENDGDEEGPKKPEFNVRRMSVQDAISLFENKQKDQTVDIQKARSLLTASIGASKSVLRRWSSGMGEEDSSQCVQDTSAEDEVTKIQDNVQSTEITPEAECPTEDYGSDVKLDLHENGPHSPVNKQEETITNEPTDVNEKLIASSEWSRQKEAELNELLMKMMETKPVKSRTVVSASSKRQSLPSENRGGLYDDYKEKRDEKLRGEATKKRSDKDKQVRAVQQIVDAKKSQVTTSANASDAGKKQNVKKLQKPQKIVSPQPANPKTESPKPAVVKKASPKASSLPATRKSWSSMPSMPSPRANGTSPAKTPAPTSSTMPARRRSQPTTPVSHTSSTVDKTQTRVNKSVKSSPSDSKKTSATEIKQQQSVTKPKKTTKSKVQTPSPEDLASSTKPSLYNKVTKKSSVVPIESKPFLRKGSGISSGVNPALKKKTSSPPQEQLKMCEDLTLADENVTVSNSSDVVMTQHEEEEIGEVKVDTGIESVVPTLKSPQKYEENEVFNECNTSIDDVIDKGVETKLKAEVAEEEEEEPTISPAAWVEIEEHEDHTVDHTVDHGFEIASSQQASYVAPVGVTSPRVRHSLSQMLLQEISEHDADWGNAENPPPTVFHKDAPKGLKRLLNFARKSKTDANASGWSSPTVFSEGEDDNDDSKFVNKRSAENLQRKSTLHSKNNGNQRNSTTYEHPGQANISRHNGQRLSQQIQDGHVTASVTTTKAPRSFFSLSAFKGSK